MSARTSLVAVATAAVAVPMVLAAGKSHSTPPWRECPAVRVTDGDTIRCGPERVRLLGIDSPELHNCPRYRRCAPGDGKEARRSLQLGIESGPVRLLPVTVDRYGRTVAMVMAGSVNLSCWQLERGEAIYKPQWDNGGLVGHACRNVGISIMGRE